MSVTRVKVVSGKLPSNFHKLPYKDKKRIQEDNLKDTMRKFRKACSDYGILPEWKAHERYEKPSEKKRKVKRQRELQNMKDKRRRQ